MARQKPCRAIDKFLDLNGEMTDKMPSVEQSIVCLVDSGVPWQAAT